MRHLEREARVAGASTAVVAVIFLVVGYYLQMREPDEQIGVIHVVGIGICYIGLLSASIGAAVGLKKTRNKPLKAALAVQLVIAAALGIALAFDVIF